MNSLHALVSRLRDDAEVLRRYGDSRCAQVCQRVAGEVEAALLQGGEQLLNLKQAAAHSGYSTRQLSRMIDEGKLANLGRAGAPRVRLGDLPRKLPQAETRSTNPEFRGISKRQIAQSIVNSQR